jgi:hypothetical protein
MKSAFGGLAGSLVFGPQTTGANVFGGGGSPLSFLGTLLGHSSGTSSSVAIPTLPGVTAGGGLSSAIAGTAATNAGIGLPLQAAHSRRQL